MRRAIMFIGLVMIFASIVAAVYATVLQKQLQHGIDYTCSLLLR